MFYLEMRGMCLRVHSYTLSPQIDGLLPRPDNETIKSSNRLRPLLNGESDRKESSVRPILKKSQQLLTKLMMNAGLDHSYDNLGMTAMNGSSSCCAN